MVTYIYSSLIWRHQPQIYVVADWLNYDTNPWVVGRIQSDVHLSLWDIV